MDKAEITIFVIIANIVLLVFFAAFVIFIQQYRKRKLLHEKEKQLLGEQHAKELLATQLQIQQLTMQDIGQEIHDSVGQKLTLASLYTQQLSFTNKIPAANEQLTAIGDIINESLTELRSLSKSLTGQQLQQANLMQLLEAECERINASGVCKARVESNKPIIITEQPALNMLLRMLQEFMQNSLKHAACNFILIKILQQDNWLIIIATDDGKGFNVENAQSNNKGIGIANMKRRAGLIGAVFEITSHIGKGTQIIINLPNKV